ncbi:MAG: aspartate/glutamate racemase family protein [Lachnospiraceae bacterium]
MKTIGLIGGMSWESTVTYYQVINETIKKQLGGLHSAKILLYSVDFAEIEECQSKGEWERSAEILGAAAQSLKTAGADFILICTNTMHKVLPQIQRQVNIPFLHIAGAAAEQIVKQRINKVLLLGTKYTMQQDFYKEKLIVAGIEVLIPDEMEMDYVNMVIFEELCLGKIREESRQHVMEIIERYVGAGIGGVVLGCTEIGLLIEPEIVSVPVFDTALIHAEKAAILSLE